MLKSIAVLFIFFCIVLRPVQAQVPSPLIFSRITKNEGMASNTVFQAVRDKKGFLWMATQNGLQRYDGTRFLTFRRIPGNPASLAQNTVNRILIDSKERMWLLFDTHAGIFNSSNFTYTDIKISVPVMQIKKIVEDDRGRIILFADSKQLQYNQATGNFTADYPLPALPAGYAAIGDMAYDASSGICLLTGKQGSLLLDPKTKQYRSREQHNITDPLLDSFCAIKNSRYPFIAQDGTWWMVNWIPFTAAAPVLYSYNKSRNQLEKFEKIRAYKADSYYEIWGVFQQSNGTIWVYGMGLLAYYNPAEKKFVNINSNKFEPNGINYDMVNHLYEDDEKNVWVSTNNGLYRFNAEAQVFRNISNHRINDTTVYHNAISSIVQTRSHGIWVGSWGAGIFSYNKQLEPIANPVTDAEPANRNLHVSYMAQRRNGEVWIGTQSGQLKIFDPATNKCFTVNHTMLQDQGITQLLEDHSGNMWIGTNAGLLVKCLHSNWQDTTNSYVTILNDLSDIMRLYEDRKNNLWVCTSGSGLYQLDVSTGKVERQFKEGMDKNDGLLNDGATDIVQYNDSTYLVASNGLCILNSRTNTFTYLLSAYNLPPEHITTLVTDKQKRLWVAMDGGLIRLNSIESKLYVSFGETDGIVNNIFQVAASAVLDDGRIILGTPHDFVVFDPSKTINTMSAPPVTITGFSVGDVTLNTDSIARLKELVLKYDNTFVKIELSNLCFRDDFSTQYMLEGLDKTWQKAENNTIIYQYLPPGDYVLQLKTRNGEDPKNAIVTSLRIHVNAPFWKTWWFYILLILAAGGLLFLLDKWRMKRKETILNIRSNIAGNLHKDISSTLGNITILSEMAKMKAADDPDKSKEFIEQIHTKSQDMSMAMEDILWSIDPGNDSMENFMLRFNEYIESLKSKYNTSIDVLTDKKAAALQLKMEVRKDVYWLFKGGITNVTKTGGSNNRIYIAYEKNTLIYTLEFDTARMNMAQINNLRLRKELADKLESLQASLDFKEHSSSAMFVLKIPIKENKH